MKRVIVTASILLLMAGMASAQDLATYTATYEKKLEAINLSHERRMADLIQVYTNSLDALVTRAGKAGDLDTIIAVREEVARIEQDWSMPEIPSVVPGIRKLQAAFKKQEFKHEVEKARKVIPLTAQYDKALARFQKSLVVSDKVEEAVAVREERMRAQNAAVHLASKEIIEAFAKNKPPKPKPKKSTPIPSRRVSEATVTVVAKEKEWTGTGLFIKKSEYVRLKTSGEIRIGTADRHLGTEGKWLQIRFGDSEGLDAGGKSARIKATEDGEIFFRLYDNFYNDNSGVYVVEIKGDFERIKPAEPVP